MVVIFLYPFITVIVDICAQIGIVTGSGLSSIISKKYSKKIAFPIVILLIIANIINIDADLGAISASFELLFPQVPLIIIAIFFQLLSY
ncbi:MAG TPA: divalent metal cation transporter [Nitrososphaeraceae archaeon]|nr:divalent metal cation transporter [Nitrososphaeraceae archaeon]